MIDCQQAFTSEYHSIPTNNTMQTVFHNIISKHKQNSPKNAHNHVLPRTTRIFLIFEKVMIIVRLAHYCNSMSKNTLLYYKTVVFVVFIIYICIINNFT